MLKGRNSDMKRPQVVCAAVLPAVVFVLIHATTGWSGGLMLGKSPGQIDSTSSAELSYDWIGREWSTTYLTPYDTYAFGDKFAFRVDGAPMVLMSEYDNFSGGYRDEDIYLFLSVGAILLGSGIIVAGLVGWLRGRLV